MIHKVKSAVLVSAALVLLLILGGCDEDSGTRYDETLTQVSTIDAILNGVYDGVITQKQLTQYGDFGIGTFAGLDGEMVVLDGQVYQVKVDGVAYETDSTTMTPFAAVTFFDTDRVLELDAIESYDQLDKSIDAVLPSDNRFYGIKIEGEFEYIKTRSVPGQSKPYPPLVEVTKNQATFEFENVKGTIVGFRSPPYVTGVNVPGYHLHFLTESRNAGGHLLEIKFKQASVSVDDTSEFFMILPDEGSDFYDIDLSQNKEHELQQAEK